MDELYFEPTTIEEALRLAAEHRREARFVAGGTDLVVLARKKRAPLPNVLIALHRIMEMRGVGSEPDGSIRIGAGTSLATLEAHEAVVKSFSALADSSALVGSPATRHVGTIGGNLNNASPAMETGSPLLVFGASVELASAGGTRSMRLEEFLVGPGQTALAPEELLTAVRVPAAASTLDVERPRVGSAYVRLDYRQAMEIAVAGAAAVVALGEDGRVTDARLALTAVAPTCVLVPLAAEPLRGREPTDERLREAADVAVDSGRPIDDVRASAGYRRAMISVVVCRALDFALRRARGEDVPVPSSQLMKSAKESSEVV